MKLETAYHVSELVRRHANAIADKERMEKIGDVLNKADGQILTLSYTDADGDSVELFDLVGDSERFMLFDFLRDVCQKRADYVKWDLDKIFPEIDSVLNTVIRVQFVDVANAQLSPENQDLQFESVQLKHLPMSMSELKGADEVWLINGDHERRLWSKAHPHAA